MKINVLIVALGVALFCAGVAAIYWPLALIVAGAALAASGLFLNLGKLFT